MELSLFLAKLFGIYMLIVAAMWLVRRDAMTQTMVELFENRALLFLSGLLALAVGIAMVIGHSVWELNWRGLITLIGYLSIAKGIARIAYPEVPQKAVSRLLKSGKSVYWIAIVAAIGGYLTWAGFTQG